MPALDLEEPEACARLQTTSAVNAPFDDQQRNTYLDSAWNASVS